MDQEHAGRSVGGPSCALSACVSWMCPSHRKVRVQRATLPSAREVGWCVTSRPRQARPGSAGTVSTIAMRLFHVKQGDCAVSACGVVEGESIATQTHPSAAPRCFT